MTGLLPRFPSQLTYIESRINRDYQVQVVKICWEVIRKGRDPVKTTTAVRVASSCDYTVMIGAKVLAVGQGKSD